MDAESDAALPRPCGESLATEEHAPGQSKIRVVPQLQECLMRAAGRGDEAPVVLHHPRRIIELGKIRQIEYTSHLRRRTWPFGHDERKPGPGEEIEQLPPVLERQAHPQPCLVQVELA